MFTFTSRLHGAFRKLPLLVMVTDFDGAPYQHKPIYAGKAHGGLVNDRGNIVHHVGRKLGQGAQDFYKREIVIVYSTSFIMKLVELIPYKSRPAM